MFENADLYRTNWRERYFDAFSCYVTRYTFIWRTVEHSSHKLWMIFLQCGKLSAKFFLSSVKVIDAVGFLSFFKVLLEQLLQHTCARESTFFILPHNSNF